MVVQTWPNLLPVYAGDSWSQTILFGSYNDSGEWVPEDIREWSDWESQWRPTPEDSRFITLTVSVEDGGVTLSATPEDTRDMGGPGIFDVQAVNDSEVRTFARGVTSWQLDVTRV